MREATPRPERSVPSRRDYIPLRKDWKQRRLLIFQEPSSLVGMTPEVSGPKLRDRTSDPTSRTKRPAAAGLHPVAELPETKKLTQCMSFSSVGMTPGVSGPKLRDRTSDPTSRTKRPVAAGLHPVAELPKTEKLTQCMSFSSVGMTPEVSGPKLRDRTSVPTSRMKCPATAGLERAAEFLEIKSSRKAQDFC